jgi:hypothetical protein
MNKNITSKLNNGIEQKAEADVEMAREIERLRDLEEYRKRAMDQFFEDGSCTGGDLKQ